MTFVRQWANGQVVEVYHPFWPLSPWAVGPVWIPAIVTNLASNPDTDTGVLETYTVALPDGSLRPFDVRYIRPRDPKLPAPPARPIPAQVFTRTFPDAARVKVFYQPVVSWGWASPKWVWGYVEGLYSAPTLLVPEQYHVYLDNGIHDIFDVALLRWF